MVASACLPPLLSPSTASQLAFGPAVIPHLQLLVPASCPASVTRVSFCREHVPGLPGQGQLLSSVTTSVSSGDSFCVCSLVLPAATHSLVQLCEGPLSAGTVSLAHSTLASSPNKRVNSPPSTLICLFFVVPRGLFWSCCCCLTMEPLLAWNPLGRPWDWTSSDYAALHPTRTPLPHTTPHHTTPHPH